MQASQAMYRQAEIMFDAQPPLIQAVQARRMADLKKMLSEGADANVRSPYGSSAALHIAALNGHRSTVSMLLKYGADKDALDQAGETPLMKAANLGHLAVVEILLKAGADVNVLGKAFKDEYSRSFGGGALHRAAGMGHRGEVGHHGIVRALLAHGADANALDDRGYTPLALAILSGSDLPIVETLLRSGADTDVHGDDGVTPLIWATISGDVAVVETLAKAGANLDMHSVDGSGEAALHAAASRGFGGVVEVLLEHGAYTDVLNNRGETPLVVAVSHGHLQAAEILLEFNANPTMATAHYQEAPLHLAVQLGRPDIVSALLDWGADTLVTDRDHETPLVWAARDGNARLVAMMMAERAALVQSSTDGCVALRVAIKHGREAVVSILLEGPNQDALECDGERPLIWAAAGGHLPMVEALLKAGVKINVRRGSDGCAALHLSAGGGHDDIVSALLRKGAYKDVLDNRGTTPLHWATAAGQLVVVETLLATRVNLNIRSRDDGFPALHRASAEGFHGIVSALLRNGADVDVVDPNGDTALNWAARLGHVRVVKALLAAGADVTIRNSVEGYSAFHWASMGNHDGVKEAILRRLAEVHATDEDGPTDIQALIDEEFSFDHPASAKDEDKCSGMHPDSCTDREDTTNTPTEEELNVDPAGASDEDGGIGVHLDSPVHQVDTSQTTIEDELNIDHPVSAGDENGGTNVHIGSPPDQLDATQMLIEAEFDFGPREQTETVRSASLAEIGGGSFRRVLAVVGWLDLEGICLAMALCFWFSCRCKHRM